MTEREKMIAGMIFDVSGSDMPHERKRSHQLCNEYNRTNEDEEEKRLEILDQLLGAHGAHYWMEPDIRLDFGANITLGENFYSNYNLTILDNAPVTIGNDVLIGPCVTIATAIHPLVAEERRIHFKEDGTIYNLEYAKPVTIGNDVWIAAGVTVAGGVTIGDGAVIGCGSVVVRDIPAGYLAVGNPCRPIRKITEKDRMIFDRPLDGASACTDGNDEVADNGINK